MEPVVVSFNHEYRAKKHIQRKRAGGNEAGMLAKHQSKCN